MHESYVRVEKKEEEMEFFSFDIEEGIQRAIGNTYFSHLKQRRVDFFKMWIQKYAVLAVLLPAKCCCGSLYRQNMVMAALILFMSA